MWEEVLEDEDTGTGEEDVIPFVPEDVDCGGIGR